MACIDKLKHARADCHFVEARGRIWITSEFVIYSLISFFFSAELVKAIETEVPHIVRALEELSTNSRTRSTSALILAEISK